MMDSSIKLVSGDLVGWFKSLKADEVHEYPGDQGTTVYHGLFGLADIMVKPVAINPDTGEMVWEMTAHTHPDYEGARECHRRNVAENERRQAEEEVNPDRAVERAMAERMGMPREMIDKLLPLEGEGGILIDEILRRMGGTMPEAPTSGPPMGWPGPANWGDDAPEPPTGFYM